MKTAFFTLFLFVITSFPHSVFSQSKDSASIFAGITSSEKISLSKPIDFEKSLILVHSTGVKSNKTDLEYTLRYPESQDYMSMTISGFPGENPKTKPEILINFDEDKMITFMNFADSKMAMVRNLSETKNGVAILNASYQNLEKTGKSKKILGYSCIEYTFKNPDLEGSVWLAPSIGDEFAQSFSTLGLYVESDPASNPGGYIMRLKANDINTGEILSLVIKDINQKAPYSIDAENYVVAVHPSE